ncbi:MAG: hypothetical protein ACRC33_28535 [Gemmataceae bacterium]
MSTDQAGAADGPRLRWMLIALACLAAAALAVWWPGCRTYPPVSSRESLSLMKLLYAACNTRDPGRLAAVEQGVAKAAQRGKMGEAERQAFGRILALARGGDWPGAERAALRFAEDQVGVGHPDPDDGAKPAAKKRP